LTNSEKTPRRKTQVKNAPDEGLDGGLSRDPSSSLAALLEQKEEAQADKAELLAKILNSELIFKTAVTSVFGNVFSTWRNQFLEIGLSLGDTVCAIAGIPENEGHIVRKIMSDMAYGLAGELQKKLIALITDGGEREKLPRKKNSVKK
jgi:hypothetical protein